MAKKQYTSVHEMVHMPVSIIVGHSVAMDRVADRVKAEVLRQAAQNRLTGDYMSSIKIAKVRGRKGRGKKVTDRLIYSDDKAANVIEWGRHTIKYNRKDVAASTQLRRVGGQFPMTRALAALRFGGVK